MLTPNVENYRREYTYPYNVETFTNYTRKFFLLVYKKIILKNNHLYVINKQKKINN